MVLGLVGAERFRIQLFFFFPFLALQDSQGLFNSTNHSFLISFNYLIMYLGSIVVLYLTVALIKCVFLISASGPSTDHQRGNLNIPNSLRILTPARSLNHNSQASSSRVDFYPVPSLDAVND